MELNENEKTTTVHAFLGFLDKAKLLDFMNIKGAFERTTYVNYTDDLSNTNNYFYTINPYKIIMNCNNFKEKQLVIGIRIPQEDDEKETIIKRQNQNEIPTSKDVFGKSWIIYCCYDWNSIPESIKANPQYVMNIQNDNWINFNENFVVTIPIIIPEWLLDLFLINPDEETQQLMELSGDTNRLGESLRILSRNFEINMQNLETANQEKLLGMLTFYLYFNQMPSISKQIETFINEHFK